MPRLRRLSGREIAAALGRFGFRVVSQRGSHMKLQRITPDGHRETLTIPDHSELDTGTCRAILRQASRFVSVSELGPIFSAELGVPGSYAERLRPAFIASKKASMSLGCVKMCVETRTWPAPPETRIWRFAHSSKIFFTVACGAAKLTMPP
ncbi:MAG: type II toxin-antitoxin system HicA family toxin [Acidobacteriota bacterium]|nr:type II toxin-antitoxin system HicA family toxin [Acidobacteriota bacterium]